MKTRTIHINGKEWRYFIGKSFIKFISPNGKNSFVVKKYEVQGVPHKSVLDRWYKSELMDVRWVEKYQDEIRHYMYTHIKTGEKVYPKHFKLNPQKIKEYIKENHKELV